MNRGRRCEAIFSDDQNGIMFTEFLKETSDRGKMNEGRNVAIYLTRKLWRDT